jgi:hypothetical protein
MVLGQDPHYSQRIWPQADEQKGTVVNFTNTFLDALGHKACKKSSAYCYLTREGILTWYPGWNSLDSVRAWHTIFEISGIAILALLVGAEILAFQYGHRKDELTAIAESSAEIRREQNEAEANKQHDADTAQLAQELAVAKNVATEAVQKARELDRLRQPRHLTEDQKDKLMKFITENSKGTANFTIKANAAESDARAYADEIAAFFNAPPLNWQVKVDNAMIMGADVSGIWITIKDGGAAPVATGFIHEAFTNAGFPIRKEVQIDPGVPSPDEIWLTVGSKR